MSEATSPVSVGDVLAGKYRIDRVLGAGGMGVVVAATHVDLDQKVAIKFLLPQALANPEVVERFTREARAAVKIQSEHVARVSDVGKLESGAPYMVMEYLEGSDLAHRIASGPPLSVAEAARFLLEACEALAEAHAAGIVHRDIKPANLFLAKRADRTSSVKVLDFGISKANVGGAAGGITSTQAVMGSPYYMSPEQLMSAKHVDARSDVWSLGIVLYEALVGSPPYVGETLAEIVAKILQGDAPRVTAHRSDVSAEVDAVIARCLAKDAAGRYRDVGELATALATLTPDGARSVERISRVLGSSIHPPAEPSGAPRASVSDAGRGGTVAMSRTPITAPTATPAHASTSPGWGTTSDGLPKKSRTGLWLGVAAVIGLGGVGAVVLAMKKPPAQVTPSSNGLAVSIDVPHVPPPPPAEIATATTAQAASTPPPPSNATTAAIAPTSRPIAKPVASAKAVPSATSTNATPATTTAPTSALHMGIK